MRKCKGWSWDSDQDTNQKHKWSVLEMKNTQLNTDCMEGVTQTKVGGNSHREMHFHFHEILSPRKSFHFQTLVVASVGSYEITDTTPRWKKTYKL